ncbi:MAG: hypothetical protein AAGG51_14270 [Cyanobacteria bacterium P01_G01_bin.54]
MDAFNPIPPAWVEHAIHAFSFHCPHCGEPVSAAQNVWLNRRAPVMETNNRRKFQEFYQCACGGAWWAWSSDRPPSELAEQHRPAPSESEPPTEP